jgi:murein DD-endopeptidase MepM/ murein hydrolase activator NlpD
MERASRWAMALALLVGSAGLAAADRDHRKAPKGDAGVATLAADPEELSVPEEQSDVPIVDGVPLDQTYPALTSWTHPVADSDELIPVRWQRKFNARREDSNSKRLGCRRGHHCGVDLSGPRGRTVVAVTDGVVVHIERRRNGKDGKSGRYIRVEHAGGVFTAYMHLDAIAPGLSIGDKVKAGQFIGRLGKSGIHHGEAHLHFNLELPTGGKETKMIDSTPYLKRAKVIKDPAPKRQDRKDRKNNS